MNGIDVEIQRLRRGRKVGSGVALIDRGGTSMSCRNIADGGGQSLFGIHDTS